MAKYTFEGLKKKYNSFMTCTAKIEVAGYVVTEKYQLEKLTVSLTALLEASYAEFTVVNGFRFDGTDMQQDTALSSKLKTGNSISVFMGYSDTYTEVFRGYIDTVTIQYDEFSGFSVGVRCLDAKGLMMNSGRSEIKTGIKKYSDAVKNTLNGYSSYLSGKSVSATDELTTMIHQYNESDYQFLVRLARHLNYSFYIIKGKAYFTPVGGEATELIEINLKTRMLRFSLTKALNQRVNKVVVINNDEQDEKKRIKSETSSIDDLHSGGNKRPKSSAAISSNMVKTIVDTGATTAEIAKKRAQAEMDRLSYSTVEGSIEIVGIPELIPGQFLTIEGFGAEYDKRYYIRRTLHRLAGGRYTTELELGGNNL